MGIYIKGMDMPTECYGLRLIIYPNGQVLIPKSTYWEEPKGVEAIPVQDHGRLIDEDALCEGLVSTHFVALHAKRTPTIIPADKEAP